MAFFERSGRRVAGRYFGDGRLRIRFKEAPARRTARAPRLCWLPGLRKVRSVPFQVHRFWPMQVRLKVVTTHDPGRLFVHRIRHLALETPRCYRAWGRSTNKRLGVKWLGRDQNVWWAAVDSNHVPPRYQHGALPVELAAQGVPVSRISSLAAVILEFTGSAVAAALLVSRRPATRRF